MRNLFLDLKIKKDLRKFKNFKKDYKFEIENISKTDDESVFCDGICIREKNGEWLGETDKFVNVGYKIHGEKSKLLSNLFPYKFYFKGFYVNSIESIFQCFKFKDKKLQKLVFSYDGLPSNYIKGASDYDWRKSQMVFFMGRAIKRESREYIDFVDEMYISAIQNLLFRQAIKNVGDKYILHAIGTAIKTETVFSREEFEFELNCLKDFVMNNYK